MPNALLQSGGNLNFPLFDPRLARRHRDRFTRDLIPELEYANSIFIPAGRWPARGWVLLKRSDLNRMNKYATDLSLSIEDLKRVSPDKSLSSKLTFRNLSLVQARCVSRGKAENPDALYLVELTDQRGLLWNRWFSFPTTSQYNINAPAYPQTFYESTMNAGFAWTWNQMIQDLWEQMGAFLGTFPGMPITPIGIPEGWSYPGCAAWPALCDLLDYNGCYVACDLTKSSPYTIVQGGAADEDFDRKQVAFAGLLEDDMEWIDVGAGRVPATVVVYFHRRNAFYCTEETIRRDALQWQTTPLYS